MSQINLFIITQTNNQSKLKIEHDSASPVSEYKSIELMKYTKDTEQKESVQKTWEGKHDATELFTYKDEVKQGLTTSDNEAFFYK